MRRQLRNALYPLMGLIGISLMIWAGFHLAISPKAEACNQQDCAGSWTVNSSSCPTTYIDAPAVVPALKTHAIANVAIATAANSRTTLSSGSALWVYAFALMASGAGAAAVKT